MRKRVIERVVDTINENADVLWFLAMLMIALGVLGKVLGY